MSIDFHTSKRWQKNYPDALMGVLAIAGIDNTSHSDALEMEKEALVRWLEERYDSREMIKSNVILKAYARYYKRFQKNYHVFYQIESVAIKGKPIPSVNALVEAMFMAELQHGLLTAGHDFDQIRGTVTLDAASGEECYTTMSGQKKTLQAGDMFVRDAAGVLSSILYGPDKRSRITEKTERALFTVYAVEGIPTDMVQTHLDRILGWIRLFSPSSNILMNDAYHAG